MVLARRFCVICLTLALARGAIGAEAGNRFIVLAHEGYAAAVRGGDDDAIRAFEGALEIMPARLEVAVYLVQLYRKTGRTKDALDLCQSVLDVHPDDVETLYLLGATHSNSGDAQAAVIPLEKACHVDPYNARAHLLLGQEYVTLGKFEEAVEVLTRVRAWRPENDLLHRYLGQAFLGLQRTDEAEHPLREAARLAPFDPQPYFHLGRLYRMVGNANASREMMERFQTLQVRAQERERLSRAAQQNPGAAHGWFLLADHYMRVGRTRDAIVPLTSAISADKGNATYLDMRAHAFLLLSLVPQARDDAIAAIRLDPTVAAYYNTLGSCAMQGSQPTMAAEAFRQAIRVGGDVPAFHLNLAHALDALGDAEGAARHNQIARDLE